MTMINLEITKSTDQNSIGPYKFNRNTIRIGSKNGDIIICEKSINPLHLILSVHEQNLYCSHDSSTDHFHLNNIRIEGSILVKIGDEIKIGQTIFKVLEFVETPIPNFKKIMQNNINDVINKDKKKVDLFHQLEEIKKNIKQKINDTKL